MATAHCLDFHQFNETYLHELRTQDETTEAHFVAYFSKILHNKLRRRLMCPEHIKDVQQETLLRAWAAVRADGGIRQPERFGAFVSAVCNNILRESYRSRARIKPLDDLQRDPRTKHWRRTACCWRKKQRCRCGACWQSFQPKTGKYCGRFSLSKETKTKCAWNSG